MDLAAVEAKAPPGWRASPAAMAAMAATAATAATAGRPPVAASIRQAVR